VGSGEEIHCGSVSFQVFCDLWNECWQFGVTKDALCILRSTCSATSAILIHSELHFGEWRGRSGRVSVLHNVCTSRVRWIASLRGAFAWTSFVTNLHKVLPVVSTLTTQVRPKGVKKKRGLTPHEQRLENLDIVVQWALRGRVTLVDVVDKGAMVDFHCGNVVRDS
jgi:hypothetical protein